MKGTNDYPWLAERVAVFRHWHEQYGAVPAIVTYEVWEMTLENPPATDEEAEVLAKEHFAFCPDVLSEGTETIRELASELKGSTAWFFWWD